MANRTSYARTNHYNRGTTALKTDDKVVSINQYRSMKKKKTKYCAELFIIAIVVTIIIGWISCSLISTGVRHMAISNRIRAIEQNEYSSYGSGRWDSEAVKAYDEALQARKDFAESGPLARWSVRSAAGFFGSLFRLVVYLSSLVGFCLSLYLAFGILVIVRDIIRGKATLKFALFRR